MTDRIRWDWISRHHLAVLRDLEDEARADIDMPGALGERAGIYLRAIEQLAVARNLWNRAVVHRRDEQVSHMPWLKLPDKP